MAYTLYIYTTPVADVDADGPTDAKGPFTTSASTSVDGRKRAQNRTVLDFERVDGRRRRRPSMDVDVRRRPSTSDHAHPMASGVVARDKLMNIQFIKWRTKASWKRLDAEVYYMMWVV